MLGLKLNHVDKCCTPQWRMPHQYKFNVPLTIRQLTRQVIFFNGSPFENFFHGPLTRYVKLRVAHAPGMPGTFSPPPTSKEPLVSDPGMHHGTCVTHVPRLMSGSLTRGGGENVPGIPGACATHNFTYLVRGPWNEEPLLFCYSPYNSIVMMDGCVHITGISTTEKKMSFWWNIM